MARTISDPARESMILHHMHAFDVCWSNVLGALECGFYLCIRADAERRNDLDGTLEKHWVVYDCCSHTHLSSIYSRISSSFPRGVRWLDPFHV